MPTLNILNLNLGDSQEDIRNKVNANFESLIQNGGGPQGLQGEIGPQGPVGPQGPQGDPGQQGLRGTRWYVQSSFPAGGTSDPVIEGDYWVDTFNQNSIFEYTAAGWTDTGFDLQSTEVFTTLVGISGPSGSKNAVVFNSPFPNLNTLVLSDAVSVPQTANPTYAKLLISTNSSSDYPLLEFSKTNATGAGTPQDYNRHPQFRWLNPSSSNYNLLFTVPQDSMEFRAGGSMLVQSSASSLQFSSANTLSLTSAATMTVTSASVMNFSSGSQPMNFSSQNYNLSSSSLSLSVPLSLTSSASGYAMTFNNSGSGSGLLLSGTSTSTSQFLANFASGGSSKFSVRADGKIFVSQLGSAFRSLSSTYDNSATISATTYYYWYLGTNIIQTGNLLLFDTSSSPSDKGLALPVGGAVSNSWTQYLGNYESIQLRVISTNSNNLVKSVALWTGSGTINAGSNTAATFASGQSFVDFTIIRLSSDTDYQVYYSTCGGLCGKLA